jgi:hypothetical protein
MFVSCAFVSLRTLRGLSFDVGFVCFPPAVVELCQFLCVSPSLCVLTPDLACGHVPEAVGRVGAFWISLGAVPSEIVFVSCVCYDGFILSFVSNCCSLYFQLRYDVHMIIDCGSDLYKLDRR